VTHDQEEATMLADRIALMMDGELQQYDEARALYTRPASVAVAHFFRNGNLLPGTRCGPNVETCVGTFRVEPDLPQPDGPVFLTVRPEDAALVGAPGENTFTTTVLDHIFLGTYTGVEVAAGEGRWRLHAPAETRLHAGQSVHVHLPAERIWLLPR
jgi:putative spermidine/putrescine transport system ATP-binding protein